MPYISTRALSEGEDDKESVVPGKSPELCNFSESLFTGLAPDGGLYLPTEIPHFSDRKLSELKNRYRESRLSYPELMVEVMHGFTDAEISKDDFSKLAEKTMERFPATRSHHYHPPLISLSGAEENAYLLELFHGPTLAFKDYALQFLAGLMDFFLKKRQDKILILGATSGDTGSAAIHAFSRYDSIKIVMLHPHNKVSDFQRQQMTTVTDGQVWNLAVEGNFDDCQNLVKSTFSSRGFLPPGYNLTAVNSINWARILAQICYYFSAWLQVSDKTDEKEPLNFIVPSGNFGNVFAGYMAKLMGLPVAELKVAVNTNDILHRFFTHNDYRVTSLHATYSPSMDILVSSNLERYLYTLMNPYVPKSNNENILQLNLGSAKGKAGATIRSLMESLKTTGQFILSEDTWKETSHTFNSAKLNNEEILEVIKKVHKHTGILLDPHTAIGVGALALGEPTSKSSNSASRVVLATAHPVKFMAAIDSAFAASDKEMVFRSEDHALIESYSKKPESYTVFPNSEKHLQEYILAKVLD